jgi:hypothetical protein
MSEEIKKAPATKPLAAPKPPRKLVPRTAQKAAPTPVVAAPEVAAPVASAKVEAKPVAAKPATAKVKQVSKATRVEETVAKNQKVLADALVKAQAINYDQPAVAKKDAPAPKKAEKPVKAKKIKLVRDSYAMPEAEYARIAVLKKRLAAMGSEVKKSELLRGGVAALSALNDAELKAVMGNVERIKTGRPAK